MRTALTGWFSIALLVLLGGCSKPTPIVYDFQGIKIGDPESKLVEAGFSLLGKREGRENLFVKEATTFDFPVDATCYVIDGKVERIQIDSTGHFDLKAAMEEKFGPPHRFISDKYTSGYEWETTDGVFELLRNEALGDYDIGVSSSKYEKYHEEEAKADLKRSADAI